MSRFSKSLIALAVAAMATSALAFDRYENIGRPATEAEIAAWDIDVRPDFVGLPKGSGNVYDGEEIWEAQCASCHGVFGESNEVFTPLVGGTTQADIESGRVAALIDHSFPQRTTMMKVPTISTLFDYIRRAMPWTTPKSLSDDEVYALLAYMLNLADIVPADFELNDQNIREIQEKMPNRNGMTTDHGMWPGASAADGGIGNGGTPDVQGILCMENCKTAVEIASALPEYARDAHGNLADQHREVGPVRGVVTVEPSDENGAAEPSAAAQALAVANAKGCMACHGVNNKIIGPGYNEILARYKDRADAESYLIDKVQKGGQGVWGAIPMPPQGHVTDEEAKMLVQWIMSGASAQ